MFIVEAKECNRGIRKNLNIEQLVAYINKELSESGLINNRWALVVFGANGVFDKSRSLILENQIFTKDTAHFVNYFDHIPVGDGSQDIFEAIRFAAQLVFRAGASKTFILMPCSHCEAEKQTVGYYYLFIYSFISSMSSSTSDWPAIRSTSSKLLKTYCSLSGY